MNEDEKYMRRAIELAWQGIGRHSPNPMVGCVIVKDGEIVGEGFHLFDKIKHAEVIALEQAGAKAKGATVYVTVEPCCHTGRTGPCADALTNSGIKQVVYGMRDPDPRVDGGGSCAIQDAGIEVVGGILEDEIREQNKFFVTAHEKGRPYILLKWAMTLDGKIATRSGDSRWISNEKSRNIVHHMRNIYGAILVGHNTVLVDNPKLTCRLESGFDPLPNNINIFPAYPTDSRNPVRVIIDVLGATGGMPDLNIFNQPGMTWVAMAPESEWDDTRARDMIEKSATEIIQCPLISGHIDLDHLLGELVKRGIHSVLVEGGSAVHASFLESGLADEICIMVAPKIFGGDSAPSPVSGNGVETVGEAWTLDNPKHMIVDGDAIISGRVVYNNAPGQNLKENSREEDA